MSRCIPYPPPGYVRNPVAVAVAVAEVETTDKLQKEREKAERKKEKRNAKKSLHHGVGETSKHSKHTHKRRHEDISLADQESRRPSKESAEQLENSGLSEEHGAPCFIQTAAPGSPESSQDSSKRRKVILPSPSQNKNGNILRIKIKRDQEFPAATLNNSRVQQMGQGPSLLSKQNAVRPHNREVMGKSEATAAVLKQVDVQPPVKMLPKVDPAIAPKLMKQTDPRLSLEAATARLRPPSSKVIGSADTLPTKLARRVVPPPAIAAQSPAAQVFRRVDPPVPSNVLQRDAPPSSALVLPKETSPIAFRQPDVQLSSLLQKSDVPMETPLIKQQQTNSSEPSFSGRKTDKGAVPEVKQSKSDRKKSRKAEKKERKFGHLFVTWNPPSFEMEDTGDGDQDWLLGGARKPDASVSGCTASDGSVPFELVSQQFSLQPRAIHLPDLHVYQMPYVVPF